MATPNLDGLLLHAAGRVSGAGALSSNANISSIVRTAAGKYTVNLGTEIDPAQRHIMLTLTDAGAIFIILLDSTVPETDSQFGVEIDNVAGVPTDGDWSLAVIRTGVL